MLREAEVLLSFACECYQLQAAENRVFIHEHPRTAKSWDEPSMRKIMALSNVKKVNLDMCRFNLKVKSAKGFELVRKPTTLLTNSQIIAESMSKKSDGTHKHGILKGGDKCRQAATYTVEFCRAIVSAYKRHSDQRKKNLRQIGSLISRDF